MTASAGIPRHIHQIWIGDPAKMPLALMKTWKIAGWGYTLWTEKEIDALKLESRRAYDFYYKQKMWFGAANVTRVEILRHFGGIYVDADAERLLSLDDAPFISGGDFFAVEANFAAGTFKGVTRIANGVIGSIANHPILVAYAEALRHVKNLVPSWNTTGGTLLTKMVGLHRTARTVILPPHTFYPHDSQNRPSRTRAGHDGLPTYAKQFWASTHKLYSTSWHTQNGKTPQTEDKPQPLTTPTKTATSSKTSK